MAISRQFVLHHSIGCWIKWDVAPGESQSECSGDTLTGRTIRVSNNVDLRYNLIEQFDDLRNMLFHFLSRSQMRGLIPVIPYLYFKNEATIISRLT